MTPLGWVVAGLVLFFGIGVIVISVGSELDLSTPVARWRNVAVAAMVAVVAGGYESEFSGWDLLPAIVVVATGIEVSAQWLRRRKTRESKHSLEPGYSLDRPLSLGSGDRFYVDLDSCFVNVYNAVPTALDPPQTKVSIEA